MADGAKGASEKKVSCGRAAGLVIVACLIVLILCGLGVGVREIVRDVPPPIAEEANEYAEAAATGAGTQATATSATLAQPGEANQARNDSTSGAFNAQLKSPKQDAYRSLRG